MKAGGTEHYLEWRGRPCLLIAWNDGTYDAFAASEHEGIGPWDIEERVERALCRGGAGAERIRRAMVPWTAEHEELWGQ